MSHVDYVVISHGHNDLVESIYDDNDYNACTVPNVRNDRSRFCGAINYLIDFIHKYNPLCKIIFEGHYESDRKTRIYKAQLECAKYWGVPIIPLWDMLGISQQQVTTTGFWVNSTTWSPTGGVGQTLPTSRIWFYDDLHPASLPARQRFAEKISMWIRSQASPLNKGVISELAFSIAENSKIKDNFLKMGLKNPVEFFISDKSYKAASAILDLKVLVRNNLS